MFKYRLVDQRAPAMCLNLAAAKLRAELPSGKGADHASSPPDLAHDALEYASVSGPAVSTSSAALPSLML